MLLDSGDPPGLYMDQALASDESLYAEFLDSLWRSGLIRFDLLARHVVGCFFVRKKTAGSLRLVIDCRRSNILFRPPPWTPLGSLESLCRVWLRGGREGCIWGVLNVCSLCSPWYFVCFSPHFLWRQYASSIAS